MTYNNPTPWINPLNANTPYGYFKKDANAELPDSTIDINSFLQQLSQLHVPNHESYFGPKEVLPGIIGQFVDGEMRLDYSDNVWNDREIMQMPRNYLPMTQADYEREAYAKQQSELLSANMSDEQKELLANIDSYLGKSKLVEESKKK